MRYGPNETPVMEKAINSLLFLDQIEPITNGEWLSHAVIAPKPHQEDILDIDKFVWRFFINYIPLNQITKVITYLIPRCDDVIEFSFGSATCFLMDAFSGFHQI
jgi:hypothetical protein